ncbi:MAG: hypothetical protein M3Z00_04150 [Actinomycetota bacterium]|nr:hypothetical protein [Actinomycetota bacterium]
MRYATGDRWRWGADKTGPSSQVRLQPAHPRRRELHPLDDVGERSSQQRSELSLQVGQGEASKVTTTKTVNSSQRSRRRSDDATALGRDGAAEQCAGSAGRMAE